MYTQGSQKGREISESGTEEVSIRSVTGKSSAELVGIRVQVNEESYTSQASFLDGDLLPVYKPNDETTYTFSGKRVARGLYRAANGREINADVNGAGNIIRKVAPDAFQPAEGVEDGRGCSHPW